MRMTAGVVLVSLILAPLVPVLALADFENSANGVITSLTENSISVMSEGQDFSLSITDDTEIAGDLETGARVYIEWMDGVALYIEVTAGENWDHRQ